MGSRKAQEERVYSERKVEFREKIFSLLENHSKVLVVNADNVGSQQMHQIRAALRGKAVVLMGKNTMVRFCIQKYAKDTDHPLANRLADLCRFNVGLVFTNHDLKEVRDLLGSNKKEAAAKVGVVAPNAVVVPAGPTGLEPTQTSFFQALQIPTKINKGAIEIQAEVTLIKPGQKVGPSEVALLNKLGIKPFQYGLVVEKIWDDGAIYSPSVLDVTNDDLKKIFSEGVSNIAAISLATGYLTQPAMPHLIVNAFKNLLSVAMATDYSFKQADKVKAAIAAGAVAAAAAPAAASSAAPAAAAAAAKKEEPEEEDDGDMGFSLFD